MSKVQLDKAVKRYDGQNFLTHGDRGQVLNGTSFEKAIAHYLGGEHNGKPYNPDVVLPNGDIVECKFFTRRLADNGKHLQNYCNGIPVKNRLKLRKDIAEYCKGFQFLAIGIGDFETGAYEFFILTSEEAYTWLCDRVMAKGSQEVRFCYKADTLTSGGQDKRLARLEKNGFAL